MRGWSSFFVGFLLLGMAYWSFAADGLGSSALMYGTAAAFFFFCGAHGRTLGESGDATAVIDFVRDPADAIVDTATDRLSEWFNGPQPAEQEAKFDPDAAFARYMENRGADPAAPAQGAAPIRGFGRKGL